MSRCRQAGIFKSLSSGHFYITPWTLLPSFQVAKSRRSFGKILLLTLLCILQINKIIRELWRATYQGTDIDYIEIKTDEIKTEGDKFGIEAARKKVNYRYGHCDSFFLFANLPKFVSLWFCIRWMSRVKGSEKVSRKIVAFSCHTR